MGPLSADIDLYCPVCQHLHCPNCRVESIKHPEGNGDSALTGSIFSLRFSVSSSLLSNLSRRPVAHAARTSHEYSSKRFKHETTRSENREAHLHKTEYSKNAGGGDISFVESKSPKSAVGRPQGSEETHTCPPMEQVIGKRGFDSIVSKPSLSAYEDRFRTSKQPGVVFREPLKDQYRQDIDKGPGLLRASSVESQLQGLHLDNEDSENESHFECENDTDSGTSIISPVIFADIPDLPDGHPFLNHKNEILKRVLDSFYAQEEAPQDGAGGPSRSSMPCTPSSSSQRNDPNHHTRKRRDEREGSNDSGDQSTVTNANKQQRIHGTQLSFACPFCKRDPIKYKTCYNYFLLRIRDVKQHISRRHTRPLYCPRCRQEFENEDARDNHIRIGSCTPRSPQPIDGITEDQRAALGSRVSFKLSKEEQWFSVFDILFPGCPRPASPYIDRELSNQLWSLVDYFDVNGPRLIREIIGDHVTWNEEANLSDIQDQVLRDAIRYVISQWREETSGSSTALQQQPQAPTPSTTISTDQQSNQQMPPPSSNRPIIATSAVSRDRGTPASESTSPLYMRRGARNSYPEPSAHYHPRENILSPGSPHMGEVSPNYQALASPIDSDLLVDPNLTYMSSPAMGMPSQDGFAGALGPPFSNDLDLSALLNQGDDGLEFLGSDPGFGDI